MSEIIEIATQETVLVEEATTAILDIENDGTLIVTEEVLTVVSEAAQGPQGVKGDRGDKGETGDITNAELTPDPTLLFENALI